MSGAAARSAGTLAELAPRHGRAWLVGGAVRDSLLGRETPDFDLAVDGDAGALARELGRAAAGTRSTCPTSSAPGGCAHTSRTGRSI